jgi:hypothetical protein
MRTTKHPAGNFDTMADDSAPAMLAGRRERMNRAFETIEDVSGVVTPDLKRLVIVISTNFAFCHDRSWV